jgi:quaternary ammonium compound-resistance protein SugE
MAWFFLIIGGLFEIGFTISMKYSENFTKLWPSLGFLVCIISSFFFLYKGSQTIPIGTAYAVWTGIGAAGTAILGIILFKEPADLARLILLTILISSIIGLKIISIDSPGIK